MKIAVTAWKFGTHGLAQELAEQGEIAESQGFDSFWLPENHFTGSNAIPAPLILLAAVAARTRKIKLGTCLLYTSPSPRDATLSRMPSSA